MYILPQLSTNEKKKMTSQKQSKIGSSGALPHPMQAGSRETDRRSQSADWLRNDTAGKYGRDARREKGALPGGESALLYGKISESNLQR